METSKIRNPKGAGRKATGKTQTAVSVRINNGLLSRLASYKNKNRFINEAIRQRLDRLDEIKREAMNADS